MRVSGRRRKSIAFFIVFGSCLVAFAVALDIGWIIVSAREVALLVLGVILFFAIIAGLVLNTTFLVREIRRNEQHDAFINAVTHELKTPIASIRLYLETLQTREVDEEKRREFYSIMLSDSDRLLQTVEHVLRAGHLGSKKARNQRDVNSVADMVRDCVELARSRYNLPAEAFAFTDQTSENNPPFVLGDREELRAAILNVMDNAVKYSGPEKRVEVLLKNKDEKTVQVEIKDFGIGIPREQLKRIFSRFYRVPGRLVGRASGTGLGLFIVRSVVKRHSGKVFAESDGEGLGSKFTILLPKAGEQ